MIRAAGIALIDFYQRCLSPLKGFCCAHRRLHGRASCSQYIKRALARHGALMMLPLMRRRFERCSTAARSLSAQRCETDDHVGDVNRRSRHSRSKDRRDPVCCDAAPCDAPCGGIGNCDTPTSCDFPGIDAPDCGGCDLSC